MAISDISKVAMSIPNLGTDKIIGIKTGTISVAAATALDIVKYGYDSFDTGFGETCYFRGIFSNDGGATWNDFGSQQVVISGGFPVFQTVGCTAYVDPNGVLNITAENWYNFTSGSSSAQTVLYKVALIAKNNQGVITPLATNEDTYWSSATNFRKIFAQGEENFYMASGSGKEVTINHALGVVPSVVAFMQEVDGDQNMRALSYYETDIFVDENDVTFSLEAFRSNKTRQAQIEYRIYYND